MVISTKRVTFSLVIIFCTYLCIVQCTNITAFAGGLDDNYTNYQQESSMNSNKYESTTEVIQREPSYDSSGTAITKVYSDESLFNASDQNNGTQSYSVCYDGDKYVFFIEDSDNNVINIVPPETSNPPNDAQYNSNDSSNINSGQSISDSFWGITLTIFFQILGAILSALFPKSFITEIIKKILSLI